MRGKLGPGVNIALDSEHDFLLASLELSFHGYCRFILSIFVD